MRKDKKIKTRERHGFRMSLRVRIILAFAIFLLLVLGVLWLFQIVLLDDIYESLKLSSLSDCVLETSEQFDSVEDLDSLEEILGSTGTKYGVCTSAYHITYDGAWMYGEHLNDIHVNTFCLIHNVHSDDMLNRMYDNAMENDGEYSERLSLGSLLGKQKEKEAAESGENIIVAKIISLGDSDLMILFNAELLPLASSVETLKWQLIYITAILLVLAVIVACILAAWISRPIRKMSFEASKLALGDYQVNFDGGRCTETDNLSITLNRAAYELSKLDRMQKELVANVSHDLRTPLTMIAGYTEAMRDLPGEATPENMQIVIDETNRLSSLVNDMLEVSRYQGRSQRLNLAGFNFTEVVRSTLTRYAKLVEREGYTVTFEADADVFVVADENRILQVVYNLINNAVNYTGEDKVVRIRQIVTGNEVTLEVIDSGIGIAEEDLPLVWERYYKVNDFHKRANVGTGLGLSIVKNILLLHGARFGVKSKLGQGSCFWFSLPICVNNPSEAENITE